MSEMIFRRVVNILNSVDISTDKEVIFRNEGYQISHQNSPYATRREFWTTSGHHCPKVVWIKSHHMIITLNNIDTEKSKNIEIYENFPSFLVRNALEQALAGLIPLPRWLYSNFINIIIPNYFIGYDNEGRPKYDWNIKWMAQITTCLTGDCVLPKLIPDEEIKAEDEEE